MNRQTTLIATLGGQPQVITFALDALLARHYKIDQLLLIHLATHTPRLQQAAQKLIAEVTGPHYRERPLKLTFCPVTAGTEMLQDIHDEADAHASWEAIAQLIIQLKKAQHTLHVCISGGRQMLGFMTMSAAMLYFGHQDMLWHTYTPDAWLERSKNGALMHLPEEAGFKLIQVPMLPWGSYFPALRELTRPITKGADVLAAPRRVLEYGESARKTAVLQHLTPRQKEVLHAFATGLSPQEVANKLVVSIKTIHSHKTVILAECRSVWALPESTWLDYRFIAEKFGEADTQF